MQIIPKNGKSQTLQKLHQEAIMLCKKGRVNNLILTGEYPIAEANSNWVNIYSEKAMKWQSSNCPASLEFNHGQFIDKGEITGIKHLINELAQKPDSNRACLSLIDMDSIVNSKNNSFPSFMVFQASFIDDSSLAVTSFYRALEVSEFLPINIAENCLMINKINQEFSSKIKKFSITIHAGVAHYIKDFTCFEKPKIDALNQIDITVKVSMRDVEWIIGMLNNKKDLTESRINRDGLTILYNSMQSYNREKRKKVYDDEILKWLEAILLDIKEFNQDKDKRSHSHNAQTIYDRIKKNLGFIINKLEYGIK